MFGRIFFTLLFLVIWIPCILFTANNSTFDPPLPPQASLKGPIEWKYAGREFKMEGMLPRLYVLAKIKTLNSDDSKTVTIEADFIEWMHGKRSQKKRSRAVDLGPLYATGNPKRPLVTRWGVEHDAGMRFKIGPLRFNGLYLMGLFMVTFLPPLFLLWLLADSVAIDTPQERKRRDEAFVDLVKAIDAKANEDPSWLQAKTVKLAMVGYFILLGSILVMVPIGLGIGATIVVLAGGNAGAAKLAFVLAAIPIGFAGIMAKSLLLPSYPEPGLRVTRQDAPKLFEYLDGIIASVHGPRFERVFISNEVNASVSRHTGILGFFGFGPVTLTLGLPLMQSLTLHQLSGVIGHEYGHVAAKDNAKGQWIYRVRNSWLILGDRLRFEHLWYALKLNRFYEWFIAEFSAYSFALSRRCEYEADAFAAKIAGPEQAGQALSAISVHGDAIGIQFWRDFWKKAEAQADASSQTPYKDLAGFLAKERDNAEYIEAIKKEKTGYADTHPSTMDRLAALGQHFVAPGAVTRSSASELFGPFEAVLMNRFDEEWRHEASPHWQAAHEDHAAFSKRHAELRAKPMADLKREELSELVQAAHRAGDKKEMLTVSEEILRRDPESRGARLNIAGHRLTEEKDESQLSVLERCMEKEPQLIPTACSYALEYFHKQNLQDSARKWQEKLNAWEYERQAAAEERDLILASDEYEPHDLPEKTLEWLENYCAQHKVLHTVYIAKKKVKYLQEHPCYLVAFRRKEQMFRSDKKIGEDIVAFINESGLHDDFVFVGVDEIKGLEGKLRKIANARVYSVKKPRKAA